MCQVVMVLFEELRSSGSRISWTISYLPSTQLTLFPIDHNCLSRHHHNSISSSSSSLKESDNLSLKDHKRGKNVDKKCSSENEEELPNH